MLQTICEQCGKIIIDLSPLRSKLEVYVPCHCNECFPYGFIVKKVINSEELKMYQKRIYKRNVLAIAKSHKKNCKSENCNVSLMLLLDMAEQLGITFTNKQKEIFV